MVAAIGNACAPGQVAWLADIGMANPGFVDRGSQLQRLLPRMPFSITTFFLTLNLPLHLIPRALELSDVQASPTGISEPITTTQRESHHAPDLKTHAVKRRGHRHPGPGGRDIQRCSRPGLYPGGSGGHRPEAGGDPAGYPGGGECLRRRRPQVAEHD